MSALRGGLSKQPQPLFTLVSEKTTENSERLVRQARLGIEPGTSSQQTLSTKPLRHWWVAPITKGGIIFDTSLHISIL